MIDPQLRDKVVLITGANNPYGIGAAIASAFAIQGAKVLLSYLRLEPETFGIDQDTAAQMFPGQIMYGASKATIEAFTRSVAHEVGPLGIAVNTIAPGPTQTGYIPRNLETDLLPDIPLGRLGTPQDIADAAIFLASHQARWLTGQVLKVSGGHAL